MSIQSKSTITGNKNNYGFSSYGVKIGLSASKIELLNEIKKEVIDPLPFNPLVIDHSQAEHLFELHQKGKIFHLFKQNEKVTADSDKLHILKYLQNEIRTTVAEFAVSKVFLHAGAVSFDNQGIIFPAKSFQGKSTLVSELVKAGAVYYSDDFAVLDENAFLHPFPKPISLRESTGKSVQTDFPVEHFGGKIGLKPVEVKFVIITEYIENHKWSPELLSPGDAIMNMLPHTVPIRFNPKFTLNILQKLTDCAIIAKSKRGNAKEFISDLLNFFEKLGK